MSAAARVSALADDGAWARRAAVAAVQVSLALVVLDASAVNLALPTMARALGVSPAEAVRAVTAYQAALVMALLPCGALGERLGHRRVFTAGVALFAVASLLCALAPTLWALVAARFVQGLGGAAIMALGVALLRFTVPPAQLGRAIGWNALVVALCSAAGPTLGALVLSVARWPWIFAINLPVALAALLAGRSLPRTPAVARPLHGRSVALNALAFAALVLGAGLLLRRPVLGAGLLAVALGAFTALIRRERGQPAPLFPLDLLASPAFRLTVIASVCCFAGQSAGLLTVSLHLQHGLGLAPLAAGLRLTPWPLAVAVTAPLAGRLAERVSPAWLCATGAGLLAAGLSAVALWGLDGHPLRVGACVALCGVGFGLFQVPNNRSLLLAAPAERSGAAGALQGAARLTGQTSGALLVGMVLGAAPAALAAPVTLAAAATLALAAAGTSGVRGRAERASPLAAAAR